MTTEIEYKGRPVLSIKEKEDDRIAFMFGLTKAKLILSHIEEIKSFVEKHK